MYVCMYVLMLQQLLSFVLIICFVSEIPEKIMRNHSYQHSDISEAGSMKRGFYIT